MAYNTNNNQITPSLPGYAFFNKNSTIDKTMLSFNMWKTTIRMSIYPLIESENDDQVKYDRKGGISIYLTPYKAYMFAQIIKGFKNNHEEYNGKGVPSGQCLVTIEDPAITSGYKDPNANPLIVIRKVNSETGGVEMSYAYELNSEFYMVIEKYDQLSGEFVKNLEMFKDAELDFTAIQLENYANAMTNSNAFATMDAVYPFLDRIANKLGVELMPSSSNQYSSGTYFSKNPGTENSTSSSTSMSSMM